MLIFFMEGVAVIELYKQDKDWIKPNIIQPWQQTFFPYEYVITLLKESFWHGMHARVQKMK